LTCEITTPNILVTASVHEEAAGIIDQLSALKQKTIGGRPVFEGSIGEVSVRLVVTGPGMVNTAQGLTAAVEAGYPEMILMTGCAGAFAGSGMKVGDIGIATEENDVHLGIESETEGQLPAPLPFDLEVIGGVPVGSRIPLDGRLSNEAVAVLKDGFCDVALNVTQGPFVTVSTVTATDRRAARLLERYHACMESMEGSAGAHVAMHYRIPFVEIRSASNLVGKRSREEWDIPLACRRSGEASVMWIKAYGSQIHLRSADYAD